MTNYVSCSTDYFPLGGFIDLTQLTYWRNVCAYAAESNNRVLVISHHTSGQIVLKIRAQLRSAGYRVHIDPDMRSGKKLLLMRCSHFCYVLSGCFSTALIITASLTLVLRYY